MPLGTRPPFGMQRKYDDQGNLNYGSKEFQAVAGCVDFAYESVTAALEDMGQAPIPDEDVIRHVAGQLLQVSDLAQCRLSTTNVPDRFSIVHSRARGAMREALQVNLPPVDKPTDDPAWIEWRNGVQDDTDMILRVSSELYAQEILPRALLEDMRS